MAATIVFVLSYLVYGVIAFPPASTYLPPSGAVGGSPAVPSPASFPPVLTGQHARISAPPASTVQRPIGHGAPVKRVGGERQVYQSAGHTGPSPSAQRSISHGTPAIRVSGRRPAAQTHRHAVSSPIGQRPTAFGTAAKPIYPPAVGSARSNSNGRQQNSYKIGSPAGYGSRTVGSHAPY